MLHSGISPCEPVFQNRFIGGSAIYQESEAEGYLKLLFQTTNDELRQRCESDHSVSLALDNDHPNIHHNLNKLFENRKLVNIENFGNLCWTLHPMPSFQGRPFKVHIG